MLLWLFQPVFDRSSIFVNAFIINYCPFIDITIKFCDRIVVSVKIIKLKLSVSILILEDHRIIKHMHFSMQVFIIHLQQHYILL